MIVLYSMGTLMTDPDSMGSLMTVLHSMGAPTTVLDRATMTVLDSMGAPMAVPDSQSFSRWKLEKTKPSFPRVTYCRHFNVAHCWPLSGDRNWIQGLVPASQLLDHWDSPSVTKGILQGFVSYWNVSGARVWKYTIGRNYGGSFLSPCRGSEFNFREHTQRKWMCV